MQRRHFTTWAALAATTSLSTPLARAHHGWSSFDLDQPLYLEGRVVQVAWRNPHAEFELELAADLRLPADLAQRKVPAQAANVDGPRLLQAAKLPTRKERRWQVELAPLQRMQAWNVTPLKVGDTVGVLGFTLADAKAAPLVRVEYLFVGGQVYGLRSSPA
jgi:Family of unknown function (DUF6152)